MKMQNSILPNFEISNFGNNWVSGNCEIGTRKLEIRFRLVVFGMEIQNLSQQLKILVSKNEKSGHQNLNFDFDFEFWGRKFDFQNSKIVFFNFFRISSRNPRIRIQRCRKPKNLHFRFKIQIFLRPKS